MASQGTWSTTPATHLWAGEGHPAGRLHDVAVDADVEIEVFDIWESPEALQKWGPEGFVPILIDFGVELHPPTIRPVHNVILGWHPGDADRTVVLQMFCRIGIGVAALHRVAM